ncbi:MAG: LCP family protein [Oscillospiraceae bacterium]|nr:LCP family protein [Oscillospiraceae bacterium]
MKKSKNRKYYIIISALAVISLLIFLLSSNPYIQGSASYPEPFFDSQSEIIARTPGSRASIGRQDTIWFQGQEFMLNPSLTNILFLGIDQRGEVRPEGGNIRQSGQADAVMLITLCDSRELAKTLHISRDLMTDIDLYNIAGQVYGSFHGQLALQHARGRGGHSSSRAMVSTVSRILYDLPIHHYLALNIDSIALLNEVVNGVTITFEYDYSHIDPDFIIGETITMTDRQAERFVQWRDVNIMGSNEDRLDRQQAYILAFFQSLSNLRSETREAQAQIFESLQQFMITSLSIEDLHGFSNYGFDDALTKRLPGEIIHLHDENLAGSYNGIVLSEFHADEVALQELIISRFFVRYGE